MAFLFINFYTMIINILKDEKNSIPYRPIFAKEIWVISAIILQQMIYRFNWTKFYKFIEPCKNELYREWDSWTEELWLSKFEFTNWLKKIWFKLGQFENVITKDEAIVIYYTDNNRVTWYDLNLDNLEKFINKCYSQVENVDLLSKWRNLTYQVSEETWFTNTISNNTTNNTTSNQTCKKEINNNNDEFNNQDCNKEEIINKGSVIVDCNKEKERKKKEITFDLEAMFEWFYNTYPRRVQKVAAKKAFFKAMKCDNDIWLLAYAVKKFAKHVAENKLDLKFVKHPAAYLNQEVFRDFEDEFKNLQQKEESVQQLSQQVESTTEENYNTKFKRNYEN